MPKYQRQITVRAENLGKCFDRLFEEGVVDFRLCTGGADGCFNINFTKKQPTLALLKILVETGLVICTAPSVANLR